MTKVGIFRKVDGTKVFTSPNEYNAAMDAIKGMRLGPSFVIASEAVVPVVIAAVNQVPREEVALPRAITTFPFRGCWIPNH